MPRRENLVLPAVVILGLVIVVPAVVAVVVWRSRVAGGPPSEASGSGSVASATTNVLNKRPLARPDLGYAGSDACRSCHQHNHKTWHASYHRTMTQVPGPDNVVANFDNVQLQTEGKQYQLRKKGDRFFVELDDPDWQSQTEPPPRVEREIVLMTGSHHEQDFWYESPFGRIVQRLPFVYRIEEQAWYPDSSVLVTPPDSPSGFGNWNIICIQCHTTVGRPRIQPELGRAETEVIEFGISCEACHGPGAAHVERHQQQADGGGSGSGKFFRSLKDDKIINPAKLEQRASAQVCGQCHGLHQHRSDEDIARWKMQGFRYRPGEELTDTRSTVRAARAGDNPTIEKRLAQEPHFLEDRFWSDGMVRIIGREYNGLIESPCYQRGKLTCLSCHTMHPPEDDPRPLKEWANDQLKLGMESNQACLQCHEEIGQKLSEHTHHAADSVGSRCYNCHMPPTTYGLLKAVHSHQIDSPNLKPSLTAGRPNACNLCHLDKSLGWSNEHLNKWWGVAREELNDEQTGTPASILWALRGDAGQRVLIAWAMGWPPAQQASGKDWQARVLAPLLKDPYDAVRFIANRSLKTLPGFEKFQYHFVQDAPRRREISRQVQQTWEARRNAEKKSTDLQELLRPPAGNSPSAWLEKLLEQRNDRRVQLAE